jgi:hypothetical protein
MIPSFLTHYYEAERGPFKNICDLSDDELDGLISVEKNADTAFNRFVLGRDFFKIRRAADNLLIEKYSEKFGFAPQTRRSMPCWANSSGHPQCIATAEVCESI